MLYGVGDPFICTYVYGVCWVLRIIYYGLKIKILIEKYFFAKIPEVSKLLRGQCSEMWFAKAQFHDIWK